MPGIDFSELSSSTIGWFFVGLLIVLCVGWIWLRWSMVPMPPKVATDGALPVVDAAPVAASSAPPPATPVAAPVSVPVATPAPAPVSVPVTAPVFAPPPAPVAAPVVPTGGPSTARASLLQRVRQGTMNVKAV